MTDYISREAFIKRLQEKYEYLPKEVFFPGMKTALEIARELPAADVREVKQGEWLREEYVSTSSRGRDIQCKVYICSKCFRSNGRRMANFCPNCGADMREEKT